MAKQWVVTLTDTAGSMWAVCPYAIIHRTQKKLRRMWNMLSRRWLRRYGVGILMLGVLFALYDCERDPQIKKAIHMQKGVAFMAEGKYTEAIIELKNAAQLGPNDAQAYYRLGLAHPQLGLERLNQGELADVQHAFRALSRSVQLDAHNLDAQLKLGELYLLAKEFTEAQAKAEVVLQSAADNVEAHLLLSDAYAGKEEWGKAIAALRTALTLDPKRIPLVLQLAQLYQRNNDPGAAEKTYQSALEADPDSVQASLALAGFYTAQRHFAKAEAQYHTALERQPKDVLLYLAFANFYALQGKTPEVEATYQKAVKLAPQDIRPYVALGDFYDAMRQTDAALSAYKQAATIDPQALVPKQRLADLMLRQNHLDEAAEHIKALLNTSGGKLPGRYYEGLGAR